MHTVCDTRWMPRDPPEDFVRFWFADLTKSNIAFRPPVVFERDLQPITAGVSICLFERDGRRRLMH
jgi:hypothetical protein